MTEDAATEIPTALPGALSTSLATLIEERADDGGEALRFEGRTWTWSEVVAQMRRRAALLAQFDWQGPRHVGVLLDNVPEFLFVLGGAALSGSVVVGLNPTRRGEELARDVRHTDCGLVVTSAEHQGLLDGLDLGLAEVVSIDEPAWEEALAAVDARAAAASPTPTATDLLLLLFTSGSTGAPKAVRFTHGRAAGAAKQMWFGPGDVLYCAMPMFHGNALVAMVFPAIGTGATLVLKRRFSASALMPEVREHGVTFFSTVGRALSYVLATPAGPADRDHRLGLILAPEASLADAKAFEARFGVPAISGYGSSENAVIMVPQPDLPPEALGLPLEGLDVAILDPETGEECPRAAFADGVLVNGDEAVGEIVGRAAADRFEGYYNNPEAEAARTRNGWYWTGDLGYRDESGIFYFAGRTADWIRVDGENFAAAPIERLLAGFPGVVDVVVFGVADERTADDQVMAVLEVEDVAAFSPNALDAYLAAQPDVGTKWAPRYVRVLDALPLMATGKLDRALLRRTGWDVDDGVFWRPDRRDGLAPMTADDRDRLRTIYADHGRRLTRT